LDQLTKDTQKDLPACADVTGVNPEQEMSPGSTPHDATTRWLEPLESLAGQRVLVIGAAAEHGGLRALLRAAGARVMASTDIELALTVLARFPIDVIVADPQLRTWDGQAFTTVVQQVRGPGAGARVLELPAIVGAPARH
jgi:PleD family two-component response regulator